MNRSRFLAVTFALLGVAGVAGACSGSSTSAPTPGPTSNVSLGADVQALGKWCMDEQQRQLEEWAKDPSQPAPTFDHEFGAAELAKAPSTYASGAAEIVLSPSKCSRMLVSREGGRVVAETIVRGPFTAGYDGGAIVYRPAAIARFTYSNDGEQLSADYDGDGFDEARIAVTYEKEAVLEERAPSDVVLSRTTAIVAASGGVVEVKREERIDGVLTEKRRTEAGLLQRSCNPVQKKPPPPTKATGAYQGNTRACTDAERTAISGLISTGLQKGSGCLYAAGMRAQSDLVLKTYIRSEAKFECTDDAKEGYWAANETGYMNLFPGKIRMLFFSKLFSQPQSFQEGTVGHELFHFFDVHDPDLEAAASEPQLRMSDPVYACEYLCFGKNPNTCHLAACQQKKLSTSWKGKSCDGTMSRDDVYKIEKARGDGVSIASCTMGQQVGALCRSKTGGAEVQFCTTEVECATACGGSCESKSLSCLPDCR